ncbi:MAG: carbon-nitrogen hydrolase family protein, partial [Phycisphaerae bacterium]|nr:carbon-nitrogen hydrolase family protein [Phycisphaerae bacterium]
MSKRRIMVAAAQILTGADIATNAKKIAAFLRRAAADKCRIVLFHEGCLTGYPAEESIGRIDLREIARAERRICRLAGRLGIAVLLGSVSEAGGELYNDVMIVNEAGRCLGRYAKTWRAGEPWYAPGPGPVVFKVAGVLATVIICHDLRYPELVRLPVAAGAQIVFIANNESGIECENKLSGYRAMQIARGTENYVFS